MSRIIDYTQANATASDDFFVVDGATNNTRKLSAHSPSFGGGVTAAGASTLNGTSIPASKTLVVTTDKISVLAATTSAELAGVITDETGSGALVFANSPILVTPNIGAATGTSVNLSGAGTFGGKFTQAFSGESSLLGITTGTSSSSFITQRGTNASATSRTWYVGVNPFATDGSYEIKQAGGLGLLLDYSGNATIAGNLTVSGSAASTIEGTLGLNCTPVTWYDNANLGTALQIGAGAGIYAFNTTGNTQLRLYNNAYIDNGGAEKYLTTGEAFVFEALGGEFRWKYASSGTAGNAVTLGRVMSLLGNGNLIVGSGSVDGGQKLQVSGNGIFGNTTGASTTTPVNLSLGGTYGTTYANGIKLSVFDSGSTKHGLGAVSGNLYIATGDNATTLTLATNNTQALTIGTDQTAIFYSDARISAATRAYTWFKDSTPTKAWGIGSNGWAGLSGGDGSMIFGVYTGSGWYKALELSNGTTSNATLSGNLSVSGTGASSVAGSFGVGAASPVVGFAGNEAAWIVGANRTDGGGGLYPVLLTLNDTRAYNATNPSPGGGLGFTYKYNSAGNYASGVTIQGFKENTTDGDYAGGLRFLTRSNGAQPAEAMRISSGGSLGIGTTSPNKSSFSTAVTVNGATNSGFEVAVGDTRIAGFYAASSAAVLNAFANVPLYFSTNNTTKMTLDSSGNLYLGDSSTSGNFYIGPAMISSNGGANPLKFGINATEQMRLFANGNLFIGASPVDGGQKLQVSGTANFSSGSSANTLSLISTDSTAYSATGYNSAYRLWLYGNGATSAYNFIRFSGGGSNEAAFGTVQNASGRAEFVWQTYDGSAYGERLRIASGGDATFAGDATWNKNGNITVTLATASTLAGATNRIRFATPAGTNDSRCGVIEFYKNGNSFMGDLRFNVAGGVAIRNSADQLSFATDDSKNATVYGNLTVSGTGTSSVAGNLNIGEPTGSGYRLYVKAGFGLALGGSYIECGEYDKPCSILNHTNPAVSANLFQIQKQGTGVFTVSSAGNLTVSGTGTSSFGGKIQSSVATATGYNQLYDTTGITTGRGAFAITSTGAGLALGIEASVGGTSFTGSTAYASYFGTTTATPIHFVTNAAISATLTSGGNLGIGTTNPISPLTVNGSATVDGTITSNRFAPTGALLINNGLYGSTTTQARLLLSGGPGNFNTNSAWYFGVQNTAGVGGPNPYLDIGLAALDSGTGFNAFTSLGRFFSNGNFFIGASPVDGGQKLQVSGSALISVNAGGAPIGLSLKNAGGHGVIEMMGTAAGPVNKYAHLMAEGTGDLKIYTNGTTAGTAGTLALNLTSAQNGILGGNQFTINPTTGSADLDLRRTSSTYGSTVSYRTTSTLKWYHGLRGLVNDNWYLVNETASNVALEFDAATSNATFAGTVTATVNKSTANYLRVDTIVAAGSTTTGIYTFSNVNTNRSWLISTRQQGSANNTVVGFATTYGGTLTVYRIAQSNTNPSLDMNYSASGLGLYLVLGSGFGSTTWDTTITPLQG